MPFHDPAVSSTPWSHDPSAAAMVVGIIFGRVRSGKSVLRPDAVLPKPSGGATPPLPSQAAANGDKA